MIGFSRPADRNRRMGHSELPGGSSEGRATCEQVDASLLPAHELQVWTWRCSRKATPGAYRELLSEQELARAGHFVSKYDQTRFTEAHAGLRIVLGGLLGTDPGSVSFSKDERGKPRLCGDTSPPLFFSLSQADGLAAVAVSASFEVGLDIEEVRPTDLSGVVSFFSQAERDALERLTPEARIASVFRAWTRKEAFVKAIGLGLTIPFDSFDVSLAPDEPARLLWVADAPDEAARWQLAHLTPAEGYVGAVAAQSLGWHLVLNEIVLDGF